MTVSDEKINRLKSLIEEQANDEGLWSIPFDKLQTITEAYLQQELRRLHEICESLWK